MNALVKLIQTSEQWWKKRKTEFNSFQIKEFYFVQKKKRGEKN